MMQILLQHEVIDADALSESVRSDADGAVATFVGVVRANNRGREVTHLEYEAFDEMALSEMRKLAEQALERFSISDVGIAHRCGRLEIGEASVVVAVSAPHRGPAFDACRFLIDTLKQTVPIWKKEHFGDGQVWIEGAGESPTPFVS